MPLPRPLLGSPEPHFSFAGLKSAVQRAVASGQHRPADIAASFQQAVIDCLVDRTARALQSSDAPALVVAGGVAANRAVRAALAELAERSGRSFAVPPGLAVHRQCGDDRLGRGRAPRRRPDRPARRPGARPLAARRKRREGARRGGEGMSFDRLAVIGGGAWGTALAQVAATGGRDTLLWAREPEVVEAVNAAHENSVFLAGQPLDPAIRATADLADLGRLRRLAGRHPGAAYARRARPPRRPPASR